MQNAFLQLPSRIDSTASIPAPAALNVASFDPWETGVSWSKYTISSFSGNLLRVSSTKFLSCAAYISSFFILFGSTNEILAKFSSLIRLIMFATLLEHSGLFKVGI